MYEFGFTLEIIGIDNTDAACDSLYQAGLDDALFHTRDGKDTLVFNRRGKDIEAVIKKAIKQVNKAGYGAKEL